jgi:hypothetical protein
MMLIRPPLSTQKTEAGLASPALDVAGTTVAPDEADPPQADSHTVARMSTRLRLVSAQCLLFIVILLECCKESVLTLTLLATQLD